MKSNGEIILMNLSNLVENIFNWINFDWLNLNLFDWLFFSIYMLFGLGLKVHDFFNFIRLNHFGYLTSLYFVMDIFNIFFMLFILLYNHNK